ncbi:M20 metallopeptidase family protein [Salinibacillus xinjiangensis]|uniref:Amidohydrolase n=1 Tax=Salinibacillus xinjiangensis TaxID=1229268 RepID=A0A6G1X2K3_9BACI|nr:M20 family metallopeptidase [Salinibacillus xinjiangensis]MRG85130.1 amidohydrolase [Salinibacillus xinjiangensis]
MTFLKKALSMKAELRAIRRQLHQFPELSFLEYKTTKKIKNYLNSIDNMVVLTGKENIGLDTGVVGILSNGEGPTIAIRADIDALPIAEENKHNYKSQHKGVMHACGHDAHTTIGLGTAQLLATEMNKGKLTGKLVFIFQPAEEDTDENGLTGAPHLIKGGVLEKVDAVMALHVNPEEPVGNVLINEGYSMASVDTFEATLHGSGGHAAYPHHASDPIWMLGTILQHIQGIVARKVSPLEPSVISVTHIETTPSYNVIPNEVKLQGTIRSYHPSTRFQLEEELNKALELTRFMGGDYTLSVNHGEPVLYNNPSVTRWYEQTVQDILPEFTIEHKPFGLGGEDFSHMTERVPGAMFFLGAQKDQQPNRGLHMPEFDINEDAIIYGITIFAETASRFLKGIYKIG